ncbi:alpha/beta-hydrolase [Cylindrobasidium torrendii FP15055 ss-10]|uniref:Alpha/beta-hydrolase n=1 Tax=Cylindrobasidium torrendii FP15055 ss-10 TaxID=1314674 RepID=A0A0D7BMU7_9AGAR|nr:alpha/beta-hydrolase [Cylindrobasidium torrendii FP15055 ss-10]
MRGGFAVPLNYSNPETGSIAVAAILYPSNITSTDPEYRGPLLLNPGGPGGSGVDFLLYMDPRLREGLFGTSFDIISFDPRGTGRTTPSVSFYKSDSEATEWITQAIVNTTVEPEILQTVWDRSHGLGSLIKDNDQQDVIPYVTTDNTARDMLSIVEAMGFEKLQYYGRSYGTLLGATFAAMFPDKIERMILDGVLEGDAYYSGHWEGQAEDTDKALGWFASGCFSAGPEYCSFYKNASSEDAILQRVYALIDESISNPVVVPGFNDTNAVVSFPLLKGAIFQSLYWPYTYFPLLSVALAELEDGNGTLAYIGAGGTGALNPNSSMEKSVLDPDFVWGGLREVSAFFAISCTDGADKIAASLEELTSDYESLEKVSSFGDRFFPFRAWCSGWQVRPEATFRGPIAAANTSFPILIIGNEADHITPFAAAKRVSANFPGSVVLKQNSVGHCSVSSASACTRQYILRYLGNGTLPEPDTTCEVDLQLFIPDGNDTDGFKLNNGAGECGHCTEQNEI